MNLEKQLHDGLKAIPELSADTGHLCSRLLRYIELIAKWNSTHNLTSVRNPESMITRHMLDSLVILPHVSGPGIVDVGSGAGFPGIPVALARPEWQVTLVESNQKKAAFLLQAVLELGLPNISVKQGRVEKIKLENKVDTVVSRAFSSLERFMSLSKHLSENDSDHCRFIAMKGEFPDMELMQLSSEFVVEKIVAVTVPGLKAKRHLVVIRYQPG
ncbi:MULTISPECIES: 16S rRNA (guanine(527)-N(7))-methyltransferase RsmG [Nitrosomonas]|uniref:Ribosomal RNA small subunit methyltransferase G n=1 Tax=Nitrosomonas europaea (strain ATCC 19718 / CIP 103999 / KCTC 2705 / NBRC 14298) TaxID=228410 RepID=RSMG_NITEU|nr:MULTISPECIES: 16S rRNA (guanine(527)-N(7))-methyltransferase RsmG [Nitrosomonas]Q82S79.1 RecName: Full=Ribosomal RNA small subunit methyltransferase G; AltName: Full=16S rRNA 7-methylguanosine methyltransferase; Short=16S rRNA m7G methyltransferase [Nitrosomonas europaea ATCC 19718]CAD86387.1 Glucose inhibited division protein [Nitrosomonas europaea ATCC 19718]SDW89893.1 16S rRNA m(7)G-527 methyltransferase [Nitrosomonas europaea]SET43871.1 16S rRNA m(7)G-527 methyltransferase [Nitrosomonas 